MPHPPLPRPTTLSAPELAFNILSAHLNFPNVEAPLEIEILPSALCPPGEPTVIRDGNCIGIPKKLLLAAFKHAVTSTQTSLRCSSSSTKDHILDARTLTATAIILLAAPEYLTASNARKRHLLSLSKIASPLLPDALATELHLLDSLLSSPLHRHTKSPTLWSHRRWLTTHFPSSIIVEASPPQAPKATPSKPCDVASTLLHRELQIILRAASQHPRNYYAWTYLRFLLSSRGPLHQPHFPSLSLLAQGITPQVQAFCRRNVGDTSGWSALLFLLVIGANALLAQGVLRDMLEMVLRLRWRGEAAWGFLRTVVAGGAGCVGNVARGEVLVELRLRCAGLTSTRAGEMELQGSEEALMVEVMGGAIHWIEKNWLDSS